MFTPIRSCPDNDDAIAPPLPTSPAQRSAAGLSEEGGRKREAPFFIIILLYNILYCFFSVLYVFVFFAHRDRVAV